jgi:hypothetical protein
MLKDYLLSHFTYAVEEFTLNEYSKVQSHSSNECGGSLIELFWCNTVLS